MNELWRLEKQVVHLDKYTDRARRVLVLAEDEARRLGHNYIGTEHILLGLARDDGIGAGILEHRGLNLATLRTDVESVVGKGPNAESDTD